MEFRLLTEADKDNESLKDLFQNPLYTSRMPGTTVPVDNYFSVFADTYLSGLKSFRAFALVDNDKIISCITTHQSSDNAEWYRLSIISVVEDILPLNSFVEEFMEKQGLRRYFSVRADKDWDSIISDRYDSVEDFVVPAKTKPFYNTIWQVLYGRNLPPFDSIVECHTLKKDFRTRRIAGGNI